MVTEKKREGWNRRQTKRRNILREYVNSIKESGCVKCGETHIACMLFHHVDPKTKKDTINKLVNQTKSLEKVKEEIDKCILLCANCHSKLHWEETH